jgi:ribosomal protein L16 Arg81 hydroxylase
MTHSPLGTLTPAMASLGDAVAPVPLATFLRDTWERTFARIEGWPGKFHPLFSWDALNHVLATHRMTPSRLRLLRNRAQIPGQDYLSSSSGVIDADRLRAQLQRGATLALDHVEELSFPLRQLIADVERLAWSTVHANLYAAWRSEPGFGVHYDLQDTFILQVHGRKRWRVWAPTLDHPVAPNDARAPVPQGEPDWSGLVAEGDLLYMPRGWWHAAQAIDEACLHITMTIPCLTGADVVRWMARELEEHALARRNVPAAATPEEQRAYHDELRALVDAMWGERLLDRYRQHTLAQRVARPHFDLPALEPTTRLP